MAKEKRKFERHDLDIPIIVQLGELVYDKTEYLNDISIGGLSFKSKKDIKTGTVIDIKIPLIRPVFEAKGEVVWCRKEDSFFNVGLKFVHKADAFRLRMIEQICHIEKYKKDLCAKKGEGMTGEQAALDWIKKFAKYFPQYKKSTDKSK
ncbi:MAG: PilZ domain-containing protein [Endomicrobiales bacterium]|nr:PilZ domain-containing protein [Endomicrobiales bacterium]